MAASFSCMHPHPIDGSSLISPKSGDTLHFTDWLVFLITFFTLALTSWKWEAVILPLWCLFQTSYFDWPLDAFSSSLILLSRNVNFSENSLITSSLFPSFLLETSVARSDKRAGRSSLGTEGCVILITTPGRVSLILERKHCLYSSVTHLFAKGRESKDLFVLLFVVNLGLALGLTFSTITISCTLQSVGLYY